jgi:hypothetical protein
VASVVVLATRQPAITHSHTQANLPNRLMTNPTRSSARQMTPTLRLACRLYRHPSRATSPQVLQAQSETAARPGFPGSTTRSRPSAAPNRKHLLTAKRTIPLNGLREPGGAGCATPGQAIPNIRISIINRKQRLRGAQPGNSFATTAIKHGRAGSRRPIVDD